MITPQSFSLEWINAVSRQYKADRILVENSKHLTVIKDCVFLQYEYTKLNKLKKTNPEAFFYLYKAINNR